MTEARGAERSSSAPPPAARRLALLGLVVLGLAALTVVLVVVLDADLGSATVGLALAGGALVLCLRSLHRMVAALSTSGVEGLVAHDPGEGLANRRALREERRRLLRALNELAFDHEMGKLSDEDYRAVREGYELRAVEVMRALEAEPGLDPELEQELRRRGVIAAEPEAADDAVAEGESVAEPETADEATAEGESVAEPETEGRGCAACGRVNDSDARFCKQCGKELAA